MEFYWLTTDEYTLGFYSTLEKAKDAARRHQKEHGIYTPMEWQKREYLKTWVCDNYYIYRVDRLDEDHF